MRFSTLTALLLPLGTLASPVATPAEDEVSAPLAGLCSILVPFGTAVSCHSAVDERSSTTYRFSTALAVQFECFATSNGNGFFRTKSINGVCYVKERDIIDGALCRVNTFGVIC